MEVLDQIINYISTVGFPIVITLYLLWDNRTASIENRKAICDLTKSTNRTNELIEHFLKITGGFISGDENKTAL